MIKWRHPPGWLEKREDRPTLKTRLPADPEIRTPALKDNILPVDWARGLAIFSVLARHLGDVLKPAGTTESRIWSWLISNGTGGVFMFLVVSGFLITRIIDAGSGGLFRPSWKNFYVRRAARILPLFLLHVLGGFGFMFAVLYFFSDHSPFFIHCFKLPRNAFDGSFWLSISTFSFNWAEAFLYDRWQQIGVYWVLLWSLAVEEQFYILYPVYLRVLGTPQRLALALSALAFLCFFIPFPFPADWHVTTRTAVLTNVLSYGEIALGVLLYLACKSYGPSLLKKPGLCFLLSGAGSALIVFSYCPSFFSDRERDKAIVMGIGAFTFLLGAVHLKLPESRALRFIAFPGKYSYASYLFHIGILYLILPPLRGMDVFEVLGIYLVGTTTFAFVSYRMFEFPVNNLIRGIFKIPLKT
jgi:peptidoglycan/LPS O-acetylase OafA/YrhL